MTSRTILTATAFAVALAGTTRAADLLVPDAFPTIQSAIDGAMPGDTVLVADGVYRGDGNRDLTFNGKAITVKSMHGPAACTIQCDGTPEDPFRGIWFNSGETETSVLEGFTITGGATLPGAINDIFNGGGILITGASPTIRNCTVTGNRSGCWGGGICVTDGAPVIVDCRITANHSDDDGGGIFAWAGASPRIVNTLIAANDTALYGGGICLFTGDAEIVNCTITGNESTWATGVYGYQGTIRNTIIWGNSGVALEGTPDITFSNVEGGATGEGNMDVAPGFVDAKNGDFHLTDMSLLIDAGDIAVLDFVQEDFEGDPRMIGDGVDIGADEHHRVGDVNFDGTVDISDLLGLLGDWGDCAGCAADLDGNGAVDVADLLALLSHWGG